MKNNMKKSVATKSVKKIEPPKSTKTMKRVMLPEVVVTATRIRKQVDPKVKLMPKGEASKKSVDSLKRVGYGRAIGGSYKERTGNMETYGPDASDKIKKLLKKK